MTNQLAVRTPELIATEINSIKEQTRKMVLFNSIEIGRRLVEAKGMVSHGEWGKWLETNVNYSQSTANNLMKIYQEYGPKLLSGEQNSQSLGNLSYTQAVALLGVPAEEREQFIQENDVENMSSRQLQEAIKEKKQLEKKLKEAEEKANKEKASRNELENLIEKLKVELLEAKNSGDQNQAQELQKALAEAQSKVRHLEEELKKKPIDVPEVIERIPEEIEKELSELRKKAAQPDSTLVVQFKVQFDSLVAGFRQLLSTLEDMKGIDLDTHEKYKKAVTGLIDKIAQTL